MTTALIIAVVVGVMALAGLVILSTNERREEEAPPHPGHGLRSDQPAERVPLPVHRSPADMAEERVEELARDMSRRFRRLELADEDKAHRIDGLATRVGDLEHGLSVHSEMLTDLPGEG